MRWWLDFAISARQRIELPDEDVFRDPKALLYSQKVIFLSERGLYRQTIESYLSVFDELINTGWRPDLIRAHTVYPAGLVAAQIKSRFGIPYVLSEHMPFTIHKFPDHLHDAVRMAFEGADRVLSLGYDKVRQVSMSEIDIDAHIIFNFIDEDAFPFVSSGYQPLSPLRLITIGAASHYKDHPTLLRSLALLRARNIPFSMTMVGLGAWGKRQEHVLRMIENLDLVEHVKIIEKMTRQEIAAELAEHQVFVLTSIQEGFPNAVLEALVTGLFVVATRHGGTEDLLVEDVGRVVPIKSPEAVADVLERLYSGEIRFEPTLLREFAIEKCGRAAYSELLSKHYGEVLTNQH